MVKYLYEDPGKENTFQVQSVSVSPHSLKYPVYWTIRPKEPGVFLVKINEHLFI